MGLCCAKCLLSFRERKTWLHQVTVTCFNALVPSQVYSFRKIHPAIKFYSWHVRGTTTDGCSTEQTGTHYFLSILMPWYAAKVHQFSHSSFSLISVTVTANHKRRTYLTSTKPHSQYSNTLPRVDIWFMASIAACFLVYIAVAVHKKSLKNWSEVLDHLMNCVSLRQPDHPDHLLTICYT